MNVFDFDPENVPYIPDANERAEYFDGLRAAAETPQDELKVAVMRLFATLIVLEKNDPEEADRVYRQAAERLGNAAAEIFRLRLDLWDEQGGDKS
jgi:hypothetical protein